jgi:hypothetical protein
MRNYGVEFYPDLVQRWGHVRHTRKLAHTLASFQGVMLQLQCHNYTWTSPQSYGIMTWSAGVLPGRAS